MEEPTKRAEKKEVQRATDEGMTGNTVEVMKRWGKGKLTTSEANEELEKEVDNNGK